MRTRTLRLIFFFAVVSEILICMCESVLSAESLSRSPIVGGCEVVNLQAIFDNPLNFNGHTVCTSGYIAKEGRFVAFYPRPIDDIETMLDMALIPDGESSHDWLFLMSSSQGKKFNLIGKLDLDEHCFTQPRTHTCTPVKRPIFISSFRATPAP